MVPFMYPVVLVATNLEEIWILAVVPSMSPFVIAAFSCPLNWVSEHLWGTPLSARAFPEQISWLGKKSS